MRPEQHQVEIVRLYEEHRDVQAVAEIMNDQGLSYLEVESVLAQHRAKQRWTYLCSALGCLLLGALLLAYNVATGFVVGIASLTLIGLGVLCVLSAVWCFWRVATP